MKTLKFLDINKLKAFVTLAGVLVFLSVTGQDTGDTFDGWDSDKDRRISGTEFSEKYRDTKVKYRSENRENTNVLDNKQFFEKLYKLWDSNNDQLLDENEWNKAYKGSVDEYLDDDFDALDINKDNYIDYDEYSGSLGESDYFSTWDKNRNDYLEDNEFSEGLFNIWDANNDDFLDENEYTEFNYNYLKDGAE